jgi:hypothetical protein
MSGQINVQNTTGDADINIPVSGPKGKGTIHAVAKKEGGSWRYSVLDVQVDGGPNINLLRETSTLGSIGRVVPAS